MSLQESIRLSQLTASIAEVVDGAFGPRSYWIVADVTNHVYKSEKNLHNFDFVENDPVSKQIVAKVRAGAFGAGALSIARFEKFTGQIFTNNLRVLANVTVQFHPVFGMQLVLSEIDVTYTLGALEKQRMATLDRLVTEYPQFIQRIGDAYHTANKSHNLGRVIQQIAVISSTTSAGLEDFKHTLETNSYGYKFGLDFYYSVVQGEGNAEQLVNALVDIFKSNKKYDCVVIVRGGGAQTDLMIFDDFKVGLAIARFPFPVITGIGHQKNETIADLMAHTATKTPTKAAEYIIGHDRKFEESVLKLQKNIAMWSQKLFSKDTLSLNEIKTRIAFKAKDVLNLQSNKVVTARSGISIKGGMVIDKRKQDLQRASMEMVFHSRNVLKGYSGNLNHFSVVMKLVSPANILKRGFAVIKSEHKIVRDAGRLKAGDKVEMIFHDKTVSANVTSKKDNHGIDL